MIPASMIVTQYGEVRVSENTAALLRKRYPRWDAPLLFGIRRQPNEAEKLLVAAADGLAALCDACGQRLEEI